MTVQRTLRLIGTIAVLCGLFSIVGPVSAADTCETLRLVKIFAASKNVTDIEPLNADHCAETIEIGGNRSLHCHWRYAYRSPDAEAQYEGLATEFEHCLGTGFEVPTDPAVNHPDSYHLRQFEKDGVRFAVSLKDKAALRETYVFLRAAPPITD